MLTTWEALHRSLVSSVDSLSTKIHFTKLRQLPGQLERFADARALLAFVADRDNDLDQVDAIYAALVRCAHAKDEHAAVASTLVFLGLWPGLDAIYRRRLRRAREDPAAIASDISAALTDAIHAADLRRLRRVAATLVRNVERRISDASVRERERQARRTELADDAPAVDADRAARDISDLGVPAGLSTDAEVDALGRVLAELIGADASIVIAVSIRGESQREIAARLGLSHDAARKRFQRALRRLREVLQEK